MNDLADQPYEKLIEYIKEQHAHGYTEEQIRLVFSQANLDKDTVDDLFLVALPLKEIPRDINYSKGYLIVMRICSSLAILSIVLLLEMTGTLHNDFIVSKPSSDKSASPQVEVTPVPSASIKVNGATSSPTPTESSTPTPSVVPTSTAPAVSKAPTTSKGTTSSKPVASTPAKTTTPPAPVVSLYTYHNGTYTATGTFHTPGGHSSSVKVTLVITNDNIADSIFVDLAEMPISKLYGQNFAKVYKSQVVGKKLKDLQLATLAGATLTTQGFNSAVAAIRQQAG